MADGTTPRGADYDARFEQLAAAGEDIHGEADLVVSYGPATVLDAGCGTGRVAIELARRGIEVAGVDVDPVMLDRAREKAPTLEWARADLAAGLPQLRLGPTFDLVVMAGNVLLFTTPGTEPDVVRTVAGAVRTGGRLVAGFQLLAGGVGLDDYDAWCTAAGLELDERFATWSRDPFPGLDASYAVSVHRRP